MSSGSKHTIFKSDAKRFTIRKSGEKDDGIPDADVYTASQQVPRLSFPNVSGATLEVDAKYQSQMEKKCELFNQYAQFLGHTAASDLPFQRAEVVQQTVSEIAEIIKNAEEAIKKKAAQLQSDVTRFTSDVALHADPRWYRNVDDVTAMDDSKFVDTLNMMLILDVGDFCAYLKESLPVAAKRKRPNHEYAGRSFVGKVHMLLERVIQESRNHYGLALSLLVVVKAKVLLPDRPRVHPRFLEEEHAYIDDSIFWLLGEHSDVSAAGQYWNFAENWRVLVNAWEDLATDPGTLIRLLDPFKEKAQSEIRYNCHLAISGRLPTELAETIFEAAMLAEEVPLDCQ